VSACLNSVRHGSLLAGRRPRDRRFSTRQSAPLRTAARNIAAVVLPASTNKRYPLPAAVLAANRPMPRVPIEPCGRRARCDAARRKLEIETASLQTGCPVLRGTAGALPSGSYVLPAVTDPGVDMDAETAWPILAATGYSSGAVLSAASFDESQARTPAGAANDAGLALRSPAHGSRGTHAFPPIARGVRWLDVRGGGPPLLDALAERIRRRLTSNETAPAGGRGRPGYEGAFGTAGSGSPASPRLTRPPRKSAKGTIFSATLASSRASM
jgi:hypothetical protein